MSEWLFPVQTYEGFDEAFFQFEVVRGTLWLEHDVVVNHLLKVAESETVGQAAAKESTMYWSNYGCAVDFFKWYVRRREWMADLSIDPVASYTERIAAAVRNCVRPAFEQATVRWVDCPSCRVRYPGTVVTSAEWMIEDGKVRGTLRRCQQRHVVYGDVDYFET